MIEFKRNEKTGIVEAWKDGKKVGNVMSMGDEITEDEPKEKQEKQKRKNLWQR